MKRPHKNSNGFTLIEISIVLVIVALLIAGIVVGKTLVTTSELRKMYGQIDQYRTVLNTFKMKYNYYPGDLPTAINFFGDKIDCPSSAPNGTPGTCNGDGDGLIEMDNASVREGYRVWEQLGMAGLVDGNYAYDIASSTTEEERIGVVWPKSIRNTGVNLEFVGPGLRFTAFYTWTGHYFLVGRGITGSSGLSAAFLNPDEIYGLDLKYDDGRAGFGSIMGRRDYPGSGSAASRCVTLHVSSSFPENVNYNTSSAEQCTIVFKL